jgi:hypothetical protein
MGKSNPDLSLSRNLCFSKIVLIQCFHGAIMAVCPLSAITSSPRCCPGIDGLSLTQTTLKPPSQDFSLLFSSCCWWTLVLLFDSARRHFLEEKKRDPKGVKSVRLGLNDENPCIGSSRHRFGSWWFHSCLCITILQCPSQGSEST